MSVELWQGHFESWKSPFLDNARGNLALTFQILIGQDLSRSSHYLGIIPNLTVKFKNFMTANIEIRMRKKI